MRFTNGHSTTEPLHDRPGYKVLSGLPTWKMIVYLAALALLNLCVAAAPAADWRVESRMYVAGDTTPFSRNTTLFADGVVYDFSEDAPEATIFQPKIDEFMLIDLKRKVRTTLSTGVIAEANDRVKRLAQADRSPLRQFMAQPKFVTKYDEATGELNLTSRWISYRVQTVAAADDDQARRYTDFLDWFSRLNSAVNRGAPLPFARLEVNDALYRQKRLPVEVKLTMIPDNATGNLARAKPIQLRSVHALSELNAADIKRIADLQTSVEAIPLIEFEVYLKVTSGDKNDAARN